MLLGETVTSRHTNSRSKLASAFAPDMEGQISKYVGRRAAVGALDATRLAQDPISSAGARAKASR